MTRDPLYQAELAHDTSGVNAEPFMREALDEVIWRLFDAQKLGKWSLHDFVSDMQDKGELAPWVSSALVSDDLVTLQDEITRRLRAELWDADVTHDLAAQFASEKDQQS